MKEHSVVAEMVDSHTGTRLFPGQTFTPHDDDQRERLLEARCIREGVDPAAKTRDQLNNDGLFDKTLPQLQKLAKGEKVDLGDATTKPDIVAAIRAARQAAPLPHYENDGLADLALAEADKNQLLVIAAYEQADVPQGDAATEADLIAAIEAKRATA